MPSLKQHYEHLGETLNKTVDIIDINQLTEKRRKDVGKNS